MNSPFKEMRKGVVVNEVIETPTAKTLTIKLLDSEVEAAPGQFNMLYVFGIGEIPVSFSNLHDRRDLVEHTIRFVGAVTRAVKKSIRVGSAVGIRGPYGTGWPIKEAKGMDILVIGGGIGFAPLRPVVKHLMKHRGSFGRVNILYGARDPSELLFKHEFEEYSQITNSRFMLSIDKPHPGWKHFVGFVTDLIRFVDVDAKNAHVFMCGPEVMMKVGVKKLLERGFSKDKIFLSLERRMRCGSGICGSCQFGHLFVCTNGPVFRFSEIEDYLVVEGI